MTHADLVARAASWLRNCAVVPSAGFLSRRDSAKCPVVLTGLASAYEIPDAIGWAFGGRISILIECKASRADFHADKEKSFRHRPDSGMGRYRYFMAPKGLLKPEEMPDGWGLLDASGRRVFITKMPELFEGFHWRNEMQLLWSTVRRVQGESVIVSSGNWSKSVRRHGPWMSPQRREIENMNAEVWGDGP